jgi:hypothetical protein
MNNGKRVHNDSTPQRRRCDLASNPWLSATLGLALAHTLWGCEADGVDLEGGDGWTTHGGDSTSTGPQVGGTFVSQFPGQLQDSTATWDSSSTTWGSTTWTATGTTWTNTASDDTSDTATTDTNDSGDQEELEITEADIVKIDGDRLYALSPYAGLVVATIEDSKALNVLGKWRDEGEPFEMYVDGDQVFALYNGYYFQTWDTAAQTWNGHTSSRLVAIDASVPSEPVVRGEFEVPGWIVDSRRVGDILYVISHQDGWCWGCDTTQNTTITALNVANPHLPVVVDQLVSPSGDPSWQYPVVSANVGRFFIGGASRWNDDGSITSAINVVDISDGSGVMKPGASVEVQGSVTNRWQIDEYDGYLRVLTQSLNTWPVLPPVLETFRIDSSSEIVKAGHLELTLPRPETLQSVRFDGKRAYAVTFEQTDPLFTIDLQDPLAPKQLGMLEIPGWLTYMQPWGERLLALGYDPGNSSGSLTASLFDVNDLAHPTQLSRVNFGGMYASYPEDQNRLHKAFTIAPEESLLAVPYAGYSDWTDKSCTQENDGIALIDWANDQLVGRGVAPTNGRARRAILHESQLLALSDESLRAFDIRDRDRPRLLSEAAFMSNVSALKWVDDTVFGLGQSGDDVWEFSLYADRDAALANHHSGMTSFRAREHWDCSASAFPLGIFIEQEKVYVVFSITRYEQTYESFAAIVEVDATGAVPKIESVAKMPFAADYYTNNGLSRLSIRDKSVAKVGQYLVLTASQDIHGQTLPHSTFEVVDLQAPGGPRRIASLPRPSADYQSGLIAMQDDVLAWHAVTVDAQKGSARFYLDRIDWSQPGAPTLAATINTPGIVVSLNGAGQGFAVDFAEETLALGYESCISAPGYLSYDATSGLCHLFRTPIHQIKVDGAVLAIVNTLPSLGEGPVSDVIGGSERVFAMHAPRWSDSTTTLSVFGMAVNGQGKRATQEIRGWSALLEAHGKTLRYSNESMTAVLDAANLDNLDLRFTDAGGSCEDALDDAAGLICAAGYDGISLHAWQE